MINIFIKLDEFVDWQWVSVLWPLFVMLSILFIASLSSLFLFMAWLCTWLTGNSAKLKKYQESDSSIQWICYYALMFLLTLVFFKPLAGWLKNFKQNLHTVRLTTTMHSELDQNLQEDSQRQALTNHNNPDNARQQQLDALKNKSAQFKLNMEKELERLKIRSAIMQTYNQKTTPNFPKFLYRVSNSYYMKIGNYAHEFLNEISEKLNNQKAQKKLDKVYKNSQKKRIKYLDSFEFMDEALSIPEEKLTFDKTTLDMSHINQSTSNNLLGQKSIQKQKEGCDDKDKDIARRWVSTQNDKIFSSVENQISDDSSRTNRNYMQQFEEWQKQQEINFQSPNQKKQINKKDRTILSDRDTSKVHFPRRIKNLKDIKQFLLNEKKPLHTKNNGISNSSKSSRRQQQDDSKPSICDICCQDQADAVFMPCGHGGICFLCAFTITRQQTQRNCHLCREKITRIYQLRLNQGSKKNILNQYTRVRAAIEFVNTEISANFMGLQCIYYRIKLNNLQDVENIQDQRKNASYKIDNITELTICDEYQNGSPAINVDRQVVVSPDEVRIDLEQQSSMDMMTNAFGTNNFNNTGAQSLPLKGLIIQQQPLGALKQKVINSFRDTKDVQSDKNILKFSKGKKKSSQIQ